MDPEIVRTFNDLARPQFGPSSDVNFSYDELSRTTEAFAGALRTAMNDEVVGDSYFYAYALSSLALFLNSAGVRFEFTPPTMKTAGIASKLLFIRGASVMTICHPSWWRVACVTKSANQWLVPVDGGKYAGLFHAGPDIMAEAEIRERQRARVLADIGPKWSMEGGATCSPDNVAKIAIQNIAHILLEIYDFEVVSKMRPA